MKFQLNLVNNVSNDWSEDGHQENVDCILIECETREIAARLARVASKEFDVDGTELIHLNY